MSSETEVLWLSPDKHENISVGRQRIISHLEDSGCEITLRSTTAREVLRLVRARPQYDVIVGTTRAGAIAGALLKLVTGTPLVVDHIDPISQFARTNPWWLAVAVKQLEHAAFGLSGHTLYVYPEEAERVQRFARDATRTDLGVEYDRFAEPDERVVETARSRIAALPVADNVAIYVGGLEEIYNIRAMIDSLDYLDEWSLLILGSGSLEDEVEAAAATREDLYFLGTVPHENVPGYLHLADVGVSLVDDPHTLKVLEYGAARLPTVQLAGSAEARLGDTVVYCEATPQAIASGISEANESDEARLDDLQAHAAQFSWEQIAGEYASVLRDIQRM